MKRNKLFTSITHFILEKTVEVGDAFIDSFYPPGYPEAEFMRNFLSYRRHRWPSRASFSTLLSRLQRQGLVAHKGSRRRGIWRVTAKGCAHLMDLRTRAIKRQQEGVLDFPETSPDGVVRIVSFDIPERERTKRSWLRMALGVCHFRCLHKSVWIGERPLPEEFFHEMRVRRMIRYVHIVSVREKGTMTDAIG